MEQTKSLFEQYIDTIPSPTVQVNLKGIYKWIRAFCENRGIAAEDMRPEDLVAMLNGRESASPTTMRNNILILRGFYDWVSTQAYRSDNPANEISYHDIDYSIGCAQHYYPTYQSILSLLNQFWTPDDGQATYPLTIFAWQGIPITEAPVIKACDVDLTTGTIRGLEANPFNRLSPDMLDVLRRYREFTSARRDNNITMLRSFGADTFLYRFDMQNREAQPDRDALVNVSDEFIKAQRGFKSKKIQHKFTYIDIVKSGVLARMYAMEKAGNPTHNIEVHNKKKLGIPQAYPGDLKLIYTAYKKAFNLN